MSAKLLKRQYFDLHLILINGQQNSARVSQFKNFKISKSQNSMASVEFYVKQARTSICWNTTGKMTNQWCLWRKTALFVIHPPHILAQLMCHSLGSNPWASTDSFYLTTHHRHCLMPAHYPVEGWVACLSLWLATAGEASVPKFTKQKFISTKYAIFHK